MAFTTELTSDSRILLLGATITLHGESSGKRVRLRIDAPKEVIIVKEKIPVS